MSDKAKTDPTFHDLKRAAPGPIQTTLKRFKNAPQRLHWGFGLGALALVGMGAIALTTLEQPEEEAISSATSDYAFVTLDPLYLAGVEPEDPAPLAADKLKTVLPDYDRWLQMQVAADLDYPIAKESERLLEFARKEASGGEVETSDPANDLDLSGCLQQLEAVECVLLRYAGDGLAMYRDGLAADDAVATLKGSLRYHAAIRALFPLQFQRTDGTETLQALANQRYAVYLLKQYLPAAQSPLSPFGGQPATQSGDAAALEEVAQ